MTAANLIELRGGATSILLEEVAGGAPLWRYWGPRIEASSVPAPLASLRPLPSFSPDTDQPFTLFPTFGNGWFNQSALLAHRSGRHFDQRIDACRVEWLEPSCKARFHLKDRVAQIVVRITIALNGDDVLTLFTEVENVGDDVLDLQWLAAGVLPLPGSSSQVRSFVGRHLDEFGLQSDRLSRTGWRRENRRGLTSHDAFPGAVIILPGTTGDAGVAYGAHLAWSGNNVQSIDWIDDGRYQLQFGEWLAPGELRLEPGQSHCSPELVAACSEKGLNGLAQRFHAALRDRLDWGPGSMRTRPVSFNTWEGFYFDHDAGSLRQVAELAAACGFERFVLDDGWFHRRNDDRAGLGDWWPDPLKYPDGLGPLIDHVTGLGMEFGLWVEPEMANPDSELLRAHPDWALAAPERPRLTARNQLVLDLGRPEVADYLFQCLHKLLFDHPISYLKWDHNRDLAPASGADGRARYHRQVEATYALLARLRTAHPMVEFESCAGGGGRADFGVMRFAHRIWTSDNIDARSRLGIQRGFLQFFPPEVMGSHVGTAPAHTTGRTQTLDFRAAVALPGHFGVELDLRELAPAERERLRHWIALYKSVRPLLHNGPVWLGEEQDGLLWEAHGRPDGSELLVLVYRLEPASFRHAPPLRLAMVDPAEEYQVTRLVPGAPELPLLDGNLIGGSVLRELGLPLPAPLKAEESLIIRLLRVAPLP